MYTEIYIKIIPLSQSIPQLHKKPLILPIEHIIYIYFQYKIQ